MKTIATISIFLISMTCLFAFNGHNSEEHSPYNSLSSYANGTSADLIFPWADASRVSMEKVYSKNVYSLWRCKSQNVTTFPGQKIKGESYNYFVYKYGKFHMTVTEMNKNCVFDFFTDGSRSKRMPKDCE